MKLLLVLVLAILVVVIQCQEKEREQQQEEPEASWWTGFKRRIKSVLSKWREDIRLLWDDVLAKADDMKGWTRDMFDSLKRKLKEWLESRSEVPDDEKNEIETFISKLKLPTEKPNNKEKSIEP